MYMKLAWNNFQKYMKHLNSNELIIVNKTNIMYKFEKTHTLVTIASPLNQNLALQDADEYCNADCLACIHEGFINVIPIVNTQRRCKYVSLHSGKKRGKGLVKQIKWVKLNGETLFVVASTSGVQIYDEEVCDVKYFHSCKSTGDDMSYTNGICVVGNNILCIGTNLGTVWMFQSTDSNSDFSVIDRFHAHNDAVTLLDGMSTYLVSSSDKFTYLWAMADKEFEILRQICVTGLLSTPTALKVSNYLIFIGYESGEFCIFDIWDKAFRVRTIAHKLKISSIDFSVLKHLVLTASEDCYVKIWTFDERHSEGLCAFSAFNETGPLCGAGFLNLNCTEFCVITAHDVNVNCYIKVDNDDN